MLSKWLDEQGKDRKWLAEQIGISERQVHKLCSGESKPSLRTALKIEEVTEGEIPAESWYQ